MSQPGPQRTIVDKTLLEHDRNNSKVFFDSMERLVLALDEIDNHRDGKPLAQETRAKLSATVDAELKSVRASCASLQTMINAVSTMDDENLMRFLIQRKKGVNSQSN